MSLFVFSSSSIKTGEIRPPSRGDFGVFCAPVVRFQRASPTRRLSTRFPDGLCGGASKKKKNYRQLRVFGTLPFDGTDDFVIETEEAGGFCHRLKWGGGELRFEKWSRGSLSFGKMLRSLVLKCFLLFFRDGSVFLRGFIRFFFLVFYGLRVNTDRDAGKSSITTTVDGNTDEEQRGTVMEWRRRLWYG